MVLPSKDGTPTGYYAHAGGRPALLVFADQVCVARLEALAERLTAIGDEALTVHVVGPPALAGHDLPFPLLQDPTVAPPPTAPGAHPPRSCSTPTCGWSTCRSTPPGSTRSRSTSRSCSARCSSPTISRTWPRSSSACLASSAATSRRRSRSPGAIHGLTWIGSSSSRRLQTAQPQVRPGGSGRTSPRVPEAAWDGGQGERLARMVTQLAVSRAPRTVMTTTPAAKTRAAQSAAPRSCGGRAGQIHGVVQAALRACRVTTR
jgi:hypothetical protein